MMFVVFAVGIVTGALLLLFYVMWAYDPYRTRIK